MNSATLDKAQYAGDGKQESKGARSTSIEFRTVVTRNSVISRKEGVESDATKSDSDSRVSSRRFSSSHIERIWDVKSSEFGGMNTSSVISAGSLSGPRIDLLSIYLDIHRVASVDFLNAIPTDSDLLQRISDGNSLIKESYFGADEAQVKSVRDENRPTDRDDNSLRSLAEETLANNSCTEDVGGSGKEVATSRAVHIRITHTSSLSRKVLR
jgi:hypothetical protein